MKQRILHLSTLVEKGADRDLVELFRDLFGGSVIMTEELSIYTANKNIDFDWLWLASALLSNESLTVFDETIQNSFDGFYSVITAASHFYLHTNYAKYLRIVQPEYNKTNLLCAKTFASLYIQDNE